MEDLDGAQRDAEAGGFSLIDDVSASDDDFLLASYSEANTVDNPGGILAEGAHVNPPSDLLALERPRKNFKCNLRKSLAWDSAFFTNIGVLDPEELSSIIEGAETSAKQNQFLPEIQEDLSKSTDSISIESDSLTLESLEADLFNDIRASIQRGSKSSNLGSSSGTSMQGIGESGKRCSMKIVEPSFGDMMKPKMASKKHNSGVQGPVKASRPGSVCKQVTKPAVRSRELSSSLPRPPMATSKPSLGGATTKRMSVGASRVKLESNSRGNTNVGGGIGSLIPKVPHQVASRNTLPKAPATSKSSSASSTVNKSSIRSSRSSCDSSSSSSSENIRKSQVDVVRRKIEKSVNLPSGSKVRTPSRVLMKSKFQIGESHLSSYVKSTKLSPSVSPASSISEWSTESSSSTTVNQKHIGLQHCPTSEDVIVDGTVSQYLQKHSFKRPSDGHTKEVESMMAQSVKQTLTGSAVAVSHPGSAKPSGLRLPSPKIGFFDGAKGGTKTPSGSVRSRPALASSLPRSGSETSSPSGPANKTKHGNIAPKVTTAAAGTAKPDPRNTTSRSEPANKTKHGNIAPKVTTAAAETAKPDPCSTNASVKSIAQLQDHSEVFPKGTSDKNVENDSGTSSKVAKGNSAKSALQGDSRVAIIADGGKHVADSGLLAKDHSPGLHMNPSAKIVDKGSDTCSGLPNSPKSASERNSKVAEEADGRKHVADAGSMAKDHSEVLQKALSVNNFCNDSQTCAGLSDSPKSDLERNSKVAEQSDGRKHVADYSSMAKNHSAALQKAPSAIDFDNVPDRISELPKSFSPNSAFARNGEVAELVDGGEHARDCSSVSNDILVVSKKEPNAEGELQLTVDLVTVAPEDEISVVDTVTDCLETLCSNPSSEVDQCNRSNDSGIENLNSSQEVDGAASPHACQHEGNVVVGAFDEKDSENGVLEINQYAYAENLVEENQRMETRDHKIDVQKEPGDCFESKTILKKKDSPCSTILSRATELSNYKQNDTEQSVSVTSCSFPSPSLVVTSAARTPFAVKNSVSDMVEASNSSTGSAVEAFVKKDVVPSLEKDHKENS